MSPSPRIRSLAPTLTPLLPILAAGLLLAGCSGNHPRETGDALTDMGNAEITTGRRIAAIDAAWQGVERGDFDRPLTRRAIGELAWNRDEPDEVRLAALEALMADPTPEGVADSKDLIRLMLPHETSRGVIEYLARVAADRGWTETTPALVRALARPLPRERKDPGPRMEALALDELHPGRPLVEVAFEVFMRPEPPNVEWGQRYAVNTREDAWNLLAQLDPTGEARRRLIREHAAADPTVAAVARAERELGIVPITGDELTWMLSLSTEEDARAWWSETASVVARLDEGQRQGLHLRHLEPVRWAARHRPEWLADGRGLMLERLERRLAGRPSHRRTSDLSDFSRPPPSDLRSWADRLSWGDLVTVLAIDEAIAHDEVRRALAGQVLADRADETTEYGGVLAALEGERFVALPFPPRPSERQHDRMFVASSDMVRAGRMAIADYHFHVQKPRNGAFAGPGQGDMLQAARSGRSNVVFTSLNRDTLNADYYQPDGVVLDLGEVPLAEFQP